MTWWRPRPSGLSSGPLRPGLSSGPLPWRGLRLVVPSGRHLPASERMAPHRRRLPGKGLIVAAIGGMALLGVGIPLIMGTLVQPPPGPPLATLEIRSGEPFTLRFVSSGEVPRTRPGQRSGLGREEPQARAAPALRRAGAAQGDGGHDHGRAAGRSGPGHLVHRPGQGGAPSRDQDAVRLGRVLMTSALGRADPPLVIVSSGGGGGVIIQVGSAR